MSDRVIINAVLALSAFRRKGDDPKEQMRADAQAGLLRLLRGKPDVLRHSDPDSCINLLFAVLDHCEAEGMTHRALADAFNEHAESGRRAQQLATARELRA
ncbi:hypothetical protein [Ferrovibrio terrae]|uniref:hypothetical protein n=1 Tax=Ferrovibrio terrae TaxID=2594003 RepID=UPI0031382587